MKLSISNHKLHVGTGKYNKISRKGTDFALFVAFFNCALFVALMLKMNVENETHFLFHCPRYSSIRDNASSKIDHIIPNPKQLPISTLIVQLMNSTDYYINM